MNPDHQVKEYWVKECRKWHHLVVTEDGSQFEDGAMSNYNLAKRLKKADEVEVGIEISNLSMRCKNYADNVLLITGQPVIPAPLHSPSIDPDDRCTSTTAAQGLKLVR